jgi:hypothetical protein
MLSPAIGMTDIGPDLDVLVELRGLEPPDPIFAILGLCPFVASRGFSRKTLWPASSPEVGLADRPNSTEVLGASRVPSRPNVRSFR